MLGDPNTLTVAGSLDISGLIHLQGSLVMDGGALTAGNLILQGGGLTGSGDITVSGSLLELGFIKGGNLTLTANQVVTSEEWWATGGTFTLNFPNYAFFANGLLHNGDYRAFAGATLDMKVGGVLTTLSAGLFLDGGNINFFDPAQHKYVPVQSTLKLIAGGYLEIGDGEPLQFGALQDNGYILLNSDFDFKPASLKIGWPAPCTARASSRQRPSTRASSSPARHTSKAHRSPSPTTSSSPLP